MAAISQQLADITVLSIVVRILLSTFCAGTLGFERERHNQAAGFRTYIIVSDASALVMMTNIFVAGLGETDLVRMSASVITGLGFLGAGTIIITARQQVKGLTTAAGLWASACTGLAVGAGFYECVLIAFAMIFLSIRLFPIVDAYIQENARDINLYMEFHSLGDISTIINQLKAQNVQIYDIDIERNKSGEALHPSAIFSIRLNEKIPHTQLLSDLAELDCLCVIEEL